MDDSSALRYDRLAEESGGLGTSHLWLINQVPPGARVLDCGCAGGFVARALRNQRDCEVDGVEIDPTAAAEATSACRRVFIGSLEDEDLLASIDGEYDRIICGDVLEHLRDPEEVLRGLAGKLSPSGRILIAVPNVAHWLVRWQLLRGKFDYTDAGLLDRTHLRFFTTETARRLVEEAGLGIVNQEFTYLFPPMRIGQAVLRRLGSSYPNLFGYQSLIEAEPWPR